MKLSHINCRSLLKKVAQVSLLFKDSTVLCCTETWLAPNVNDSLVAVPGKPIFRRDRVSRGGGVCIYIDDSLTQYCNIDSKSSYISPDLEIISIDLQKPCLKHMKICCIYRPPRGDIKKCIEKLTEILDRRENFKKEIWLLGDFIIDYLRRGDVNQKRFLSLFKKKGLNQLISTPTRPGINSASCIDWIVTNCRFVRSANTTDIFISDHFAIECIRKKCREKNKSVFRNLRNYQNYDKNILSTLLHAKMEETTFETELDPNVKWDLLYTIIYDILSIMCPYKKYKQRETITPWITADIYRAIRYRDSLVNLYRLTNNRIYLTLMKQQRNIVNSMIESAKKAYISALLDKNSSCPKKFWKHINQFLKGEYNMYSHPTFVDPITNQPICHGQEAEFLNEYFCKVSARLGLDTKFDPNLENNNYLDMYQDIDDHFDFSLDPLVMYDILICSNDIDISKSCCIDGLTSGICKDLLILRPNYFVSIYQCSLSTNVFPVAWSKGLVTVIPKSGDLSDPVNWRPITQTPLFAKKIEKIVYNRMIKYFTENNIFSSYQYGFRKGKSTQQAIFDLPKYIYSNLNHKKLISSVCLNVAKAFDSINHDLLLYKLSKIGFSNASLAWFKSYLTRTQRVNFENNISPELPIITGIGQGTILGPLLFIFLQK